MRVHSLLHFSLHSPQVIWGLGSKWTSGLTALDVVLTHTTHTHTRPPQASKCSTEKKKSFITPEDTETYGPRTPPCAWIHQAWVLHKTHRSPHPPSLTLWGRIVQTLLSQLAPGRGKKKKTIDIRGRKPHPERSKAIMIALWIVSWQSVN